MTPRPVRILTWNCTMALRKKVGPWLSLAPDLAIIQECEQPAKWPPTGATSSVWHGDNPHKGLAVLAFGPWKAEPAPVLDDTVQYVLPVQVTGPLRLRLLAVWTKPHATRERSYVGQLHAALDAYAPWLRTGPSVVAGDFNSNARWDTQRRPAHADLVARLANCGLVSAYHTFTGEAHGAETQPTMYLLKQPQRPYHLDYIFVPAAWAGGLQSVRVGTPTAWLPYSDHVPVSADLVV